MTTPPDMAIRGGLLLDGRGGEPFPADLLISEGRIAEIGPDSGGGKKAFTIDAGDLMVAPGFIDVHTHADLLPFVAEGNDALRCGALSQGVTTLIAGNCGFSVFPTPSEGREDAARHLGALFGPGVSVFETMGAYASAVESGGIECNLATLVGQGTVRAAVVGFERRQATDEEIDRMRALVDDALSEGALGLSTGLLYPPGSFADIDELVALAQVAADAGKPYVSHVRNETDRVAEAVDEAIEIGRRTSASIQISHLKAAGRGNHGRLPELLALLDQASEEGIDVSGDAYPYERGSTVMHALLPPWATEGGIDATISRLRRPESRARLRRDFDQPPSPDWQNFIEGGSWDDVAIASAPRNPDMEGSTVGELAEARGEHPVDFVIDLLIAEQAAVTVTVEMANEDDVAACIASSRIMIGSDGIPLPGKPHPRWAGSFARVLSRRGRDRFGLSLPEAVRKMTSLPADRFDLGARGVIEIGAAADIVVFDEARIQDRATHTDPLVPPAGVEHVIVNGHLAVEGAKPTGVVAGRVLSGVTG